MKKQEVEERWYKRQYLQWSSKISNNEDVDVTNEDERVKKDSKLSSKIKLHALLRSLFLKNHTQHKLLLLGTLFGNKRGTNVFFALQKQPNLHPTLLIQLPTPITGLAREIGSAGSVRIALESKKEERGWRTYCNGTKLGLAIRAECGPKEWKVLSCVGPVSTGAGVLPAEDDEDEVIYMRAKFEKVVGNTDLEALYMLNPDTHLNAPPELSIYFLTL